MLISIENVVLWNEDVKSKFQKVILFFKKLADIKSNLTLTPTLRVYNSKLTLELLITEGNKQKSLLFPF